MASVSGTRERDGRRLADRLSFAGQDEDGNDGLSAWELLAGVIIRRRVEFPPDVSFDTAMPGDQWPEDALLRRPISALMVYGPLDADHVVRGPIFCDLVRRAGADHRLTVRVMPGLGHQLSPETGGTFGPMDDGAIGLIGEWLTRYFGGGEK